jgi:tRNA uracil 4-sulfurtransferase
MTYTHILARYGEIFLKGKNRPFFERKLVENTKKLSGAEKIKKARGRLIIAFFPNYLALSRVFGLKSFSPALKVENDIISIAKSALHLLQGYKTFKISAKRSDKNFPLSSQEVNRQTGAFIEKNSLHCFAFKDPEIVINIEINQDGVYLFTETIPGPGGLPVGSSGSIAVLLDDEASLLSGWLCMKRGLSLKPISIAKTQDLSLLQHYSPNLLKTHHMALSEIPDWALTNHVVALASNQTFDTFQDLHLDLTILRPLISYSREQINLELSQIQH